ncbi:MAG: class I SAM-dependent methyltransferase [Thermoplasmata archaeon]
MYLNSIYDIEWKYYDMLYGDLVDDVNFYRNKISKGSTLELMCGTGRIIGNLKHLNDRWGLDNDERMLSQVKLKDKNVNTVLGDARNFSILKKFDNIIIGLNSLLLFKTEEKVKVLENAKNHLKDNGNIFIDIVMPPDFEEGVVYLGDYKRKNNLEIYRFFVPIFSNDMKTLQLTYIYDIFEMGEYRRESSILYLYPENYDEIKEIVTYAGLKIKKIFGGYKGEKFLKEKSERMLIILEKVKGL